MARINNYSNSCKGGGGDEELKEMTEISKKPYKDGERVVAPSRRPDGTLRKPTSDSGWLCTPRRKSPSTNPEVPWLHLERGKNTEAIVRWKNMVKGALLDEDLGHASDSVKSLTSLMNELAVSSNPAVVAPSSDLADASNMESPVQDIDKRIRALKKKIRLAEAQQQKTPSQDMNPEQLEKLTRLEGWRQELKLLEGKKAEVASS
ncbi:partner of Y14 and mago-like isoform X2 [Populus alba x Populus x berolinensis]|uniref:Partner of Y14 and mago-like isoform X2 n=1 Tax=Populus alba x Populus x berolinensis TaxID=444605 RepID=A0AAD6WLB5_9ROSI|nr:partner of Y14 and mago-like isoform X2 [Populus alba x Populus x berolinensis]